MFVENRPFFVEPPVFYLDVQMSKLQEILETGLAIAQETNAFHTICHQPLAKTAIGLIVAQNQAFDRARKIRKNIFQYLNDQKINIQINEDVWKAMEQISAQQWKEWKVNDNSKKAILNGAKTKTVSLGDYRVGPWTHKALQIMMGSHTTDEPKVLLTEDSWVRQRWFLLLHHLSLSASEYPLTLQTCEKLHIHPTHLSRLLWRLTKVGVRQLIHGSKDCFIP